MKEFKNGDAVNTEKGDPIYDSYFEEEIGLPLRDAILYINKDINPPKISIGGLNYKLSAAKKLKKILQL